MEIVLEEVPFSFVTSRLYERLFGSVYVVKCQQLPTI